MATERIKEGELFSRNYLRPTEPVSDSAPFRSRLAGYVNALGHDTVSAFVANLRIEIGVSLPSAWPRDIDPYFANASVRELLDSITILTRTLGDPRRDMGSRQWVRFVRRALGEEALQYIIDDLGGMHRRVDATFEAETQATVAVLTDPRYAAVRAGFEKAQGELLANPPDTKDALQDLFEAAETLVKVLLGTNQSLHAGLVKKELRSAVDRAHNHADASARAFAGQLLEAFADWVNASHPYRHGQQTQEPFAPPFDLAVLHFSLGARYLRWLVQVEKALHP